MENGQNEFTKLVKSSFKFKLFMLSKLPAAYFSGLKIVDMDTQSLKVSIRYKWLTQNPFKSIYFASLAMAAELSTGLLVKNAIWGIKPTVSMLVFKMSADFTKKATGKIVFTCSDGDKIRQAVKEAVETGEGRTIETVSVGVDQAGDEVARFRFTWTLKQKQPKVKEAKVEEKVG